MSLSLFSILRAILVLLVIAYLAAAAFMYVSQRGFQYFPNRQGLSAAAVGLAGVEDLKLTTGDGETLQAWYAPAGNGKPTILFLHGNGGEIADRPERFLAYQSRGFGVFFLSYRGFGASTGTPSEAGLVNDALAAYDWLMAMGVKPDRLMLVGESLGGGVAIQLAARKPVAAMALEATFSSATSVAKIDYWWLPVDLLMKDKFHSDALIGKIHVPLLITHGDTDRFIPLSEGRKLFVLANEPKELVVVPGGTHGSIFSAETWERELAFFDRHLPEPDAP